MSCCKKQSKSKYMQKLGGWSIDPAVYKFIRENVEDGSVILELGSGLGTDVLAENYVMFSIEHNSRFVNKYKSTYCHAPIKDGWYDIDRVQPFVASIPKYDVILIDGPTGEIGRGKFFDNLNLFNSDVMMIFDDTNREAEQSLFNDVFNHLTDRRFEVFEKFSVIHSINSIESV